MVQEGMVGESKLAFHPDALRLGLDTLELDAVIELVELDAVEQAVEIEMPPRTAELAVGRQLHSDIFLLPDQLLDLAILDGLEFALADLALLVFRARFLERRRPQEAADLVGAEWRRGSFHRASPFVTGP